ncbi:MAG: hypothetical protein AAF383_21225 [Cyanobacteria bacterium P01_A01_bin.83]
MGQVANAVETTGKKVVTKVSNITDSKVEEVSTKAVQEAVDRALDIMQVAGDRVREKEINGERVTLEIDVEVVGIARLKITTDVPGKDEA